MRYNFKRYCKDIENVENYEKAKKGNFKGWHCHHRLETHNSDGERRLVDITKKELLALDMYYNRPAEELIFMTICEHSRLHMKGKHLSEETKKKISEALKGEKNPNYGKTFSAETRKKLREARKGKHLGKDNSFYGKHHTEETRKKLSEVRKGKHLGKENSFYGKTHSEETKKKIGEINKIKMKGMRFFNNGKVNIRAKECPDGFVHGRIKKL